MDLDNDMDLEQDCCPIIDNDKPLDLSRTGKRFSSKIEHYKDDNRCESGYKSFDSLPSGGSEVNEGRFTSDDVAVAGLESLNLGNDSDDKSAQILQSIDEGFESENLKSTEKVKPYDTSRFNVDEEHYRNLEREVGEIFQQDEDGDTRLHTSIIQLLTDQSLYYIWLCPNPELLNLKNNYLQTPLHLATITKQDLVTRKLMTSGAQVDSRDHKGNTALHIAAREGYEYFVRILLEPVTLDETEENSYELFYQKIPQNMEVRNYNGQMPVHLAVEGCHIGALDVLLSKGADVNARDGKSGRTILHYAAESGCIDMVSYLIEQKHSQVNLNSVTYGGLTPIQLARGRGHDHVVRLLKEAGAISFSDDSSEEEEMNEDMVADFKINGVVLSK